MRYSVLKMASGQTDFVLSGTIIDPARWRVGMTATPSGKFVWQGWHSTCAGMDPFSYTYTFLWHGLPVEVVTQAPFCTGDQYQISSGGITDPRTYLIIQP